MSLNGHKIAVNGIELNVYIEGEGEPILLLHGFPDSNYLWRDVIPALVAAGYQVIAPDQRGYGQSDAPVGSQHYDLDLIVSDSIELLNALEVDKAHLVGHDWGAIIGWSLASSYPERFYEYTALSVGHLQAYRMAGLEQKLKGWYVLFFQLRILAEQLCKASNWKLLRAVTRQHPECDHWISDLSRPGRFTAALNWYRGNFKRLLGWRAPDCSIAVQGVWSDRDFALAEDQMVNSAKYVDNHFSYQRLDCYSHWLPLDAPLQVAELILAFIDHETCPHQAA